MKKTLIIALHEYKRHVFRKRFLIGLFSIPLVVIVAIGLIFLIVAMESNWKPVGYVD